MPEFMGEDDKRRDGESGQRPFEENRGSRPRCLTPRCKWSGRRRVGRRWRRSVRHWLGSLLLVLDTPQDSSHVGSPMSPVRVTRKPTGWFSAAASYQRRVESSACTPRRPAQSFISRRRRSNKSDRAYAASTLFCTTCTSAASMTSRGWSVCSAAQSRNDDRKPWATAAILFSLEHLRQRRRRDSFRDAPAHARGVIAREGGNAIPASVPSMPMSAIMEPSSSTARRTTLLDAPSAIRMPTSLVRPATCAVTTPYRPIVDSTSQIAVDPRTEP